MFGSALLAAGAFVFRAHPAVALPALALAVLEPGGIHWYFLDLGRRALRYRRGNLVLQLTASDGARRVDLSLYRAGHFVLKASFEPPAPCSRTSSVSAFGAVGDWQSLPPQGYRFSGYRGARRLTLVPAGTAYLAHEEFYPQAAEYPYDALDGLRFAPVHPAGAAACATERSGDG